MCVCVFYVCFGMRGQGEVMYVFLRILVCSSNRDSNNSSLVIFLTHIIVILCLYPGKEGKETVWVVWLNY